MVSDIGFFDESFAAPVVGLVSLDVFRKLMTAQDVTPVMLVGEATFHQFHGGVATNVPSPQNPWAEFNEEYERLRGNKFDFIGYPKTPCFLGELHPDSRKFFLPIDDE